MATERFRQQLLANPELYNPAYMAREKDPRFGEPSCKMFTVFDSRKECAERGVHSRAYAGIAGLKDLGAYSICISGGYEDDQDNGDVIIYTGTGGQEDAGYSGNRSQQCDQSFNHKDNAALKKSVETGRPIRVVRGANADSIYAPPAGYRYDGMYVVKSAYLDKGKSGYDVCKFVLERCPGQPSIPLNRNASAHAKSRA